ncbi:unnamed protein product [Gongylonema pulchrum]|uniref:EB domain-containing protein n=1 Tax=Gongylonema pulchrum TaxID=637853 RepID=A0A3P7RQL9_9BILA|nr:unnamed protein product [Gongylonema pulchrum]
MLLTEHDLELSLSTLAPLLVLNRSADTPERKLNHTQFNVTQLSLSTLAPLLVLNRSADTPERKLNHTQFNVTRVSLRTNRCESNEDCKGGSYCLGYRCICPTNMIMKNGLCHRMFPFLRERAGHLGGRCTMNHTCIARNTVCQNGVCVCLPGHRIFGSTECIPKSTASLYITRTPAPNTTGSTNEITELATNEALSSVAETDGLVMMGTSLDSGFPTANSVTDTGTERIPPHRRAEIIVNISGGVCNETTLCLFFSICNNGVCKCPLGSRISETECKFIVDGKLESSFQRPYG